VKTVKFLVREAPFEAGEVRELPAREAEKFVRHGVAEYVDAREPEGYSVTQFKRDKRGSRG
jgi:hypothetical protein